MTDTPEGDTPDDAISTEAQDAPYPSSEELRELPDHIRSYIHDLETRCDRAGDLRRLDAAQRQVKELEAAINELEAEVDRLREGLLTVTSEAQTMHDLVRHLIRQPPSDPEVVQERGRDILRRCGGGSEETPLHALIDTHGLDALNRVGDGPEAANLTAVPETCGRFGCGGAVTESEDGFWTCEKCGQSYGPVATEVNRLRNALEKIQMHAPPVCPAYPTLANAMENIQEVAFEALNHDE